MTELETPSQISGDDIPEPSTSSESPQVGEMMTVSSSFRLLRSNSSFAAFFAANSISFIGDAFTTIASLEIIDDIEGSSLSASLFLVIRLIPPVALAGVGGVIADKYSKSWMMLYFDIARMIIMALFPLLVKQSVAWLYLLTLVQFSFYALHTPSASAILPDLVVKEDIVVANSMMAAAWGANQLLGSALGGFVTASFGVTASYLSDAVSYAISALLMIIVIRGVAQNSADSSVRGTDKDDEEEASLLESSPANEEAVTPALGNTAKNSNDTFLDGIVYLWNRPHLMVLISLKGIDSMIWGALEMCNIDLVNRFEGYDPALLLGFIYAVVGVSTALGPLAWGSLYHRPQTHWSIRLGLLTGAACGAVGGLIMAGWTSLAGLMIGNCIRSLGHGLIWSFSGALIQLNGGTAFLGRLFGLELVVLTILNSSSYILASLAIDAGFSAYTVAWFTTALGFIFLFAGTKYFRKFSALDSDGRPSR